MNESYGARIPADVEAPDKIVWGLTARQTAILAAAAAVAYLVFRALQPVVPLPAIAAVLAPLGGVAGAVALGRRDGLSLDAWLLAALRWRRTPRRAVPAPDGVTGPPRWAPEPNQRPAPAPTVLRLPARGIGADGVIDTGDGTKAVLVAASTVNIALRDEDEQAALIGGFARWLNSLTAPVQITVSAQRADLNAHADRITDTAAASPHPALADAAADYAEFLLELAAGADPLQRTVTVTCTATGQGAGTEAHRRAATTAAALAALGGATAVLDGPAATAVLTAATDPYQYGDASWPRTPPGHTVTASRSWENS